MKSLTYKLATQCGKLLRDAIEVPFIVVNGIDEALKVYADKKIDTYLDESETLAMQDAKYASIESKRKTEDSEHIIMISDDLTWEDWEYQIDLRRKVKPESLLMPFYRYLRNKPLKSLLNETKHAFQRLTRSWDDTATWSLDYHLTFTLGNQLKHLAETTHGWPQSDKFPEFKDWQKALHANGDYLLAYANREESVWGGESYNQEAEELAFKNAQKALRWVALNLQGLWD